MATPMTASQWNHQMALWDVKVNYLPKWSTHGRPASTAGGAFRPNGIMIHHTGSNDQSRGYVNWLFLSGRPDEGIPAPLANVMSMRDGSMWIGARGKANHAGLGSPAIYRKVVAETIRVDREEVPSGRTLNGNPFFYGNEVAFSGSSAMSKAQYDNAVRWAAAVCHFHGWTARSIIGHGEWTSAKWDPGKTDMAKFRRDVAELLAVGPGGKPPAPKPDKPEPIPPTGTYTVVKGDTLSSIARKFGTTVVTLTVWNNLKDPNKLEVGQVLVVRKPAPVPEDPKRKWVDWYEVDTLNVWGDDGGSGTKSFKSRLPHMVADVTKNKPAVITLQELRKSQRPAMKRALKAKGYKHVKSAHRLSIFVRNDVKVLHTKWKKYKTQNAGAAEGLLAVIAEIDGFKTAIGVTHLDYRPGFDNGRVAQAEEGFDALLKFATAGGVRHASTVMTGDMNSVSWVTDKAAEPRGFKDAFKVAKRAGSRDSTPIDYIYTKGRPVRYAGSIVTKSDHDIQRAVLQRSVAA